MKRLFALCLASALALPAGAETQWVTPAGAPLAGPACSAYKRGAEGAPGVCFARDISHAAADLAACAAEGGTPRMSDSMKPGFTCSFPRLDAGKACAKSTDCDLACDALTHECRAFSGMGLVLDKDGRPAMVVN